MTMLEMREGEIRNENIKDIGITYGAIKKNRWGYISAASGLSLLAGEKRIGVGGSNFRLEEFFTVGIPYEIQFFITPVRIIGMGISFMGNLNFEGSYYGLLLCFQWGILR